MKSLLVWFLKIVAVLVGINLLAVLSAAYRAFRGFQPEYSHEMITALTVVVALLVMDRWEKH